MFTPYLIKKKKVATFCCKINFLSLNIDLQSNSTFFPHRKATKTMTRFRDVGRIFLCSEKQIKTCVFFSRVFCVVLIFERHRGRLDLRYYMKM